MVPPAARREAVAHLCTRYRVSQRRACRAIGVERTSIRYRSHRPDDGTVRSRLRELAAARRRFGWRRLQVLLSREGVHLNHKKLRRLYVEERLQVRRRIGRKRAVLTRVPLTAALGPNSVGRWTSYMTPWSTVGGSASWRWSTTTPERTCAW
jgi:putative transposase